MRARVSAVDARVTALTYCDLLCLGPEDYYDLVEDHPEFGRTLLLCSGMQEAQQRTSSHSAGTGSSGSGVGGSRTSRSSPLTKRLRRSGRGDGTASNEGSVSSLGSTSRLLRGLSSFRRSRGTATASSHRTSGWASSRPRARSDDDDDDDGDDDDDNHENGRVEVEEGDLRRPQRHPLSASQTVQEV